MTKAYYESGTLHIYLSREKQELVSFGDKGEQLEAVLQDMHTGEDLGKKVHLIYDEKQKERLETAYSPDDADWDSIQIIKVILNKDAQIDVFSDKRIVERIPTGNVYIESIYTDDMK